MRRRWVRRDGMRLVGGRGSAIARLSGRRSTGRRSRPTTRADCAFRPQSVRSRCRVVGRQTMRAHRCRRWNSADRGQSAVDGGRGAQSGTSDRRVRIGRGGLRSSRRTSHSGCQRRIGPLAGGRCTNAVRRNSGDTNPRARGSDRPRPARSLSYDPPAPRSRSRLVGTRALGQPHFPSDEPLA